MKNILKNKRGSEMLTTVIAIAILGVLIINIVTMFMNTISNKNESLLEEKKNPPIIMNQ